MSRGSPKRSLSQHFLVDKNVIQKIVDSAAVTPEDTVLDIGAGHGALTQELLARGAKVVAIEKDRQLAQKLACQKKVEVFAGDFLDFPLENIQKIKVVANPPYNLVPSILDRFLPHSARFSSLTLVMQEEVARRICAQPKCRTYGSLTVFVRFYATPRYEFLIKPEAFHPSPKVDSAVVTFEPHPPPEGIDADSFFTLVRTAFSQRRKMLRSSLKQLCPGITSTQRAEELSLEEFLELHSTSCSTSTVQRGSCKSTRRVR